MSLEAAHNPICPVFGIPPGSGWDPRSDRLPPGGLALERRIALERGVRSLVDQLLEEESIVLHRLAKLFRRAVAERARAGQAVPPAIVLDDLRIVDGDVGRPLLE